MGTHEDSTRKKQLMVFKVCFRSGIGAAFVGIAVAFLMPKFPTVNPYVLCAIVAGIGGVFIGLFSSSRNLVEFVDPSLQMSQFAAEVAEGDLTQEITGITDGYMALIADNLNHMTGKLNKLIKDTGKVIELVVDSSQTVLALSQQTGIAAREVSSSMNQIASGADTQAQSTNHITNMIVNLADTINLIAQNTQRSAEMSVGTQKAIQDGVTAVDVQNTKMETSYRAIEEVSQAVELLDNNSSKIGQIVEVISSIADQTNLLALNAAIEAARAGEHGRGFAVVAEEVRKLAEQSALSAREIAGLIKQMQTNTHQVVSDMNDTKVAYQDQAEAIKATSDIFDKIVSGVNQINDQIQEISAAAQQMTAFTEELVNTVKGVAGIAQETAANSREVSSLADNQDRSLESMVTEIEKLSQQTSEIQNLLKTFKV